MQAYFKNQPIAPSFSANTTFEGSLPSVTLQADSWDDNNEQTVTLPGVLADESKQLILPTPSSANQDAFYAAGIRIISQSTDSVTFRCNTVPEEDLIVYVAVMEPKVSGSGSSEEVYSEEETRIGVFCNKPLYRRVFNEVIPNDIKGTSSVELKHVHIPIDIMVSIRGVTVSPNGQIIPTPVKTDGNDYIWLGYNPNDYTTVPNSSNSLRIMGDPVFVGRPITVILEYTKTTD